MKLKAKESMEVLLEFGFSMVEHNPQTGFQRYTKHYGVFLVTVCNNQLDKAIQITLNTDARQAFENHRVVASIHQMNHDLCEMARRGYLDLAKNTSGNEPISNDWERQMRASNPFSFMLQD